MKFALVALVAAWPLAAPGLLGSGRDWPSFVNQAEGHELRIPPGWHAWVRHGVTVVFSRPLADPAMSPATIRLRHGDSYVRIDQTADQVYAGEEVARPARFNRLPPAQGYDCGFGEGHALLFRERGRHFHVFVRLGPRTDAHEALAILNSLRATE